MISSLTSISSVPVLVLVRETAFTYYPN